MYFTVLLFSDPKPVKQEKKIKDKFCGFSECKKLFTPLRPFQKVCTGSVKCSIGYAHEVELKKVLKGAGKVKTAWHYKNDPITTFETKLERPVNAICREIDFACNCISCKNDIPIKKRNAGHNHSKGSNNSLRFDLHNLHIQCENCNNHKSGNDTAYYNGLIKVYGQKYADYVKSDIVRLYPHKDWTRGELTEWTILAKEILQSLKASNEFRTEPRTPTERIILRNEINSTLGIYTNNYQP